MVLLERETWNFTGWSTEAGNIQTDFKYKKTKTGLYSGSQNLMTRHKICSFLIHTPLVGIEKSHLLNLNSQIACFIRKKEWIQLLKKPKNIAHWCHTLEEFNDYLSASTIDLKKFQDLYGIPYFDLTNQDEELQSGSTKIEFKYTLSDNPGNPFSFYALILHEE